jgi:hypothetical protein
MITAAMKPNLNHRESEAPAPTEPDPATIWFFDSSKQLLVFRDPEKKNIAAAWSANFIVGGGWSMDGIRILPRISVSVKQP